MFDEHIEIMRDKENELLEIEKNFQSKFTVFFTYKTYKLRCKSFVEFAKNLYSQLMDEKLKSFTVAIEDYAFDKKIDFDSKLNLKKFFDKIQKVLNSSSVNINEISTKHSFGLIKKKEKFFIDKNDIETEKYEYFVKENFLNGSFDEILKHENDFLIQQPLTKPHFFFLSDKNLNSKDFEFLLKIYITKYLNLKYSRRSIGCLVFNIDKNKKRYYLNKFYNLCMSNKKNSFPKILNLFATFK
ncbi:hypothetical protein GVAV_001306 [Gurleya vavrai]